MRKVESLLNRSGGRMPRDDSLEPFRLSAAGSIAALIAQLVRKKSYVKAFLPGKPEFALGRIKEQTDKYFDIEFLNDDARRYGIDTGEQIEMNSRLDGIKIRLRAVRLESAQYSGATVLRCALPEVAYRLQRRDAFRVVPVPGSRLELMLRTEPGVECSCEVSNLSVSGVGFVLASGAPPGEIGQVFEHSRLELGFRVPLPCSFVVRTVRPIKRINERSPVGFVGAQFINLPARVQRRLQTYVQDLEREAIRAAKS